MPARIIGMIGVAPPGGEATLHVIEGGLSPAYLAEFARAHDRAGFDMVLVGYSSSSAEGFWSRFMRRRKRSGSAISLRIVPDSWRRP